MDFCKSADPLLKMYHDNDACGHHHTSSFWSVSQCTKLSPLIHPYCGVVGHAKEAWQCLQLQPIGHIIGMC